MTQENIPAAVPSHLVGDNGPSVRSGTDPALYGTATLSPLNPVEVRSYQSFALTYTVGRIGLDDTGGIRIAFRLMTDAGWLQMDRPTAPNYVTASCSGEGSIRLSFNTSGQRPWNRVLTAQLNGGYLNEGDTITIVLGDTSHGSPGLLMQTFAEAGHEFRVLTDVQATQNFLPLDKQFHFPVVAGKADSWKAVLPTLRRPGETFHFGLKAEDRWGNPTARAKGKIRLEPSLPVSGLPVEFDYAPEDRALTVEGLRVDQEGTLRIKVFLDDHLVTEAGPLVIRAGDIAGYWGDLHGQSGETVGVGTLEAYCDFARNKSFLDVSSHQANDFQITSTFWEHLNTVSARFDEPGRFVFLPGYEWSANTAVGGDHNVFFRHEGRPIRRCSHALLEDQAEMTSDAHTLTDLYAALKDEDCVLYAHVGGRYANIFYDHDPKLETAVEMHSAWGTFEWILTDGFPMRRRVGVVCNSDGHKGRPGSSYPGSSTFGAYGGLTCFLTDRLDRDAIFEAQRRRHHYGTTGCRMFLDVEVDLPSGGVLFERNPDAVPDTPRQDVTKAMMGDIVQTGSGSVTLRLDVKCHSGIERIEIRNGTTVLEIFRPYAEDDLGDRIRVLWSGAEYRGRGRNTRWTGKARFAGCALEGFTTVNKWNPESLLEPNGPDSVIWDTITTGNYMGFDARLGDARDGTLAITTNRGDLRLDLGDIGLEDNVLDAGGLDRKLRVFRLPDEPLQREIRLERTIDLSETGDNPIWVCVTTEDGYQAWSSPVYLFA